MRMRAPWSANSAPQRRRYTDMYTDCAAVAEVAPASRQKRRHCEQLYHIHPLSSQNFLAHHVCGGLGSVPTPAALTWQ